MTTRKVIEVLYKLVKCPDLNQDGFLNPDTETALAEAQDILDTYWEELGAGMSTREVLEEGKH